MKLLNNILSHIHRTRTPDQLHYAHTDLSLIINFQLN